MNKSWHRRAAAAALAAVALSACGKPQFASYDDAAYAGALCTDRGYTRVPDNYCPIGDGPVADAAFPYFWTYRPYRGTDSYVDVVYVGYPVDRTTWVTTRPPRVSALHIDRGSYPDAPPAGTAVTGNGAVRVVTEPVRTLSGVMRGGLGVPRDNKVTGTQNTVPAKAAAVTKAPTPPAPPTRPMAKPSAPVKSGKSK